MGEAMIIQGGMGAGVSDWRLANAVSRLGALGVISGTALDEIFARRLQDGDPGGDMRRALDHMPLAAMAERVWRRYYHPGGRAANAPYLRRPMLTAPLTRESEELLIAANFVEVWLAREGHANPVGVNYLEKVQLPHLASIFGAMLAGVDYVLMGAGIPVHIPGVLDRFARLEPAEYALNVCGGEARLRLDPQEFFEAPIESLKRPKFLAIITSHVLAQTLLKRANGRVDGFIVEGRTAGGHNAPPRGKLQLNEIGEPIYGERDEVDLAKLREFGSPFWLAGGYGSHDALQQALELGAMGVQVGTAFAFCEESGLRDSYRRELLAQARRGEAKVFTDPLASPTGFPFKVAQLEGTLSQTEVFTSRPRICDQGYLRESYMNESGAVAFRCAAEPLTSYVAKGGKLEDTVGRKCVCNGLLANIGLEQRRGAAWVETGIVTTGDDLNEVARFLAPGRDSYSAADVVAHLMHGQRIAERMARVVAIEAVVPIIVAEESASVAIGAA